MKVFKPTHKLIFLLYYYYIIDMIIVFEFNLIMFCFATVGAYGEWAGKGVFGAGKKKPLILFDVRL